MHKAKILIIENELIETREIEKQLINTGHSVTRITSFPNLLPDEFASLNPDIVLINIKENGTGPLSGFAGGIINNHIPIIYLTPGTASENFPVDRHANSILYLSKPVDVKELCRTIEITLNKKQVDKKLIEIRQKYEVAVKAGKIFTWELWLNENKLIADKSFSDYLGFNLFNKPLTYENWLDLFHSEDREAFEELLASCRQKYTTEIFFEHKLFKPDKSICWVTENAILFPPDGEKPLRLVGAVTDITDRKKSEFELAKSEQRFRNVFDNSGVGMAILFPGKTFSKVNSAFCKMLGYKEHELLRMGFKDITHPDDIDSSFQVKNFLLNSGFNDSANIEKRYLHKSGEIIWTTTTITLVRDSGENSFYFVIQCQDISTRKNAEEALARYADELKLLNISKDKFFSIISHDLRNPFNTLLGLTEYMVQSFREMSKEELFDSIHNLHLSAQKLYNLILNLLEWSRLQTGGLKVEKSEMRLSDILAEEILLYKDMSRLKNISLDYDIPDNIVIFADRYMIGTIIRNLVSNAIKFTPSGGTISINSKIENGFAIISVEDSGIGISNENLENLFRIDTKYNRDGTSDEKGTGLGLILCKEFAEKNGGIIKAESQLNKGSRFSFTVPVSK